jgi:hypothetical protein
MNVIKNFIEDLNKFKQLQNFLTGPNFPWFFQNSVAGQGDTKGFYFTHNLFVNNKSTEYFNSIATPILGRLKFNHLIRVRANCYVNTGKVDKHKWHVDGPENHQVALLSINNCNGFTEFENGDKCTSEENKIVLFDGKIKHRSCTQTDEKIRINININFV